jgi:hypothetical protein
MTVVVRMHVHRTWSTPGGRAGLFEMNFSSRRCTREARGMGQSKNLAFDEIRSDRMKRRTGKRLFVDEIRVRVSWPRVAGAVNVAALSPRARTMESRNRIPK